MKAVVILGLALVAASSSAFASVASELAAVDKREKACIDKDSSNVGMKTCSYEAYEQADRILNRVYKSIVAKLKAAPAGESVGGDEKEKLKRLIAAEQAWIAYKDAECNLQGIEMLGGTGEGLVISGCLFDMTKQRAKTLSELFEAK